MPPFPKRAQALALTSLLFLSGCIAGTPDPAGTDNSTQAPSTATSSPVVANPDVVEEEATVGAHALPGVLASPAEAAEPIAVVLLWGSGPHDMDSTVFDNAIFRDLADGLAVRGITSLRFDKRTFAAQESYDPATFTLDDEYFDDATAALELLGSHPDLAGYRLFVIGHSQGGMVLPEVLTRNPQVTGGISMAGSPRSLFDIMYDQQVDAVGALGITEEQATAQLELARTAMDEAKAIDDPSDDVPALLGQSMGAAYIASMNELTPAATASGLDVPLLFLQGEEDKQVYFDPDFRAWEDALSGEDRVEFISYPGLSHFFWESQGGTAMEDMQVAANVEERVIDDIAGWLVAHGS